MGPTYVKKSFVVDLRFKFNWVPGIFICSVWPPSEKVFQDLRSCYYWPHGCGSGSLG